MTDFFSKISSFFLTLSLLLSFIFSGLSGGFSYMLGMGTEITVNESKTYQEIDGWGTSACWWSQIAGESENMADVVKELYSEDGLALNIYRYNVGGGERDNPDNRIDDPWRRTESFYYLNEATEEYEFDFTRDAAAQAVLQEALFYGCIDTVVLFANSPHYSMTASGQASGGLTEGESNLPKENYQAFVDYLLTITEYFLSEGVPVKYISPINEPQWGWGGDWVGQEGCHYEAEEVAELLGLLARGIEERGLDVKISGPESGEVGGSSSSKTRTYLDLMAKDEVLMRNLGTFAYHSYWSDDNEMAKLQFGNWLKANYSELKVEMSEWCELPCLSATDDINGALITARVISNDMALTGASSWSAWVGVNGIGIGDDGKNYSDGLLYANDDFSEYGIAKRYYALAHYSKFIPVGSVRIDASKTILDLNTSGSSTWKINTSAYKTPNGDIVVVVVNESGKQNVIIDMNAACMNVYQTTAEYDLQNVYSGDVQSKISVPGNSITTIVYEK